MIKATKISYSYGSHPLFENASFSVGTNIKAGLVGPNGSGKSTLFKLLTGDEQIIIGKLETSRKIGYVPQEVKTDVKMDEATTIKAYIDPLSTKADHELLTMLHGLELQKLDLTSPPLKLSGGQKTKLALLRALIEEPEILLLDEPTNFLDTQGKQWIMQFLSTYPKTLLMISHDLKLLDEHIEKVISINPFTKTIEEFKGNYSSFVKVKAAHDALLKRKIINEQKHIKHMEESLIKMQGNKSKKGVRQRVVLKRRIKKLKENLPELPKEIQRIKINLPDPSPTGELPIAAYNITKLFNHELVLADTSLSLRKKERVAILGPNGAGKSTFIKILVGSLLPDSGEVKRDPNLSIGYYSQEFETFNLDQTLIELIREKSSWTEEKVRPFLAKFNFQRDKVFQRIQTLSGGEKTRLSIALLMVQNHNLLILDEPTTYLDVMSQRIILEALKSYTGAMLFVSHTEEFVEELKPSRVLLLPENRVTYWLPELTDKISEI